jgi:hypothetical protein
MFLKHLLNKIITKEIQWKLNGIILEKKLTDNINQTDSIKKIMMSNSLIARDHFYEVICLNQEKQFVKNLYF